jgi:2-(1,2-epoxy-1,2-dihydrophenyl)acetyl-CoA isomerase
MEMAFTGRKVGAEEALRIGLVNQVVPADKLQAAAAEYARNLAAMPTRAIGLTKRAINAAWDNDLQTQLDFEAALQATAARTRDYREGVFAFFEKRKPQFKGE